MNWTDKIDQQQNALLSLFYMFIFMALLVIRTGLDMRGAPASYSFSPYDTAPLDDDDLSASQCDQLDQLYAETLVLLYVAELVARRLAGIGREIYELMKQAHLQAQSLRYSDSAPASQYEPASARLDSS